MVKGSSTNVKRLTRKETKKAYYLPFRRWARISPASRTDRPVVIIVIIMLEQFINRVKV